MSEPFIGEVRMMSFGFPPQGWAQCNGQLLSIQQNQALFSILGTTYGGNGVQNFGLPDLRGRVPISIATNGSYVLGQVGGEENHTLSLNESAPHSHALFGDMTAGNINDPALAICANGTTIYNNQGAINTQLANNAIQSGGGGQPHPNLQPYLTVNFCIALQGIYPSRS
ncbi:MAG TPA: tail fiber protein [Polyangia bacterium]|nr:tail fiber protein [Polyangia bacterium]